MGYTDHLPLTIYDSSSIKISDRFCFRFENELTVWHYCTKASKRSIPATSTVLPNLGVQGRKIHILPIPREVLLVKLESLRVKKVTAIIVNSCTIES